MPSTPYMKLYIGDYLGDTSHLSALQHGAYLLLIMAYWQRGGPLRNTDVLLSNIARTTPAEWAECRETILEFFEERNGYLYHKRIERELHKRAEISEKCKEAVGKRWNERNTDVLPTNNERNTTPIDPYSIDPKESKDIPDAASGADFKVIKIIDPTPSAPSSSSPPKTPRREYGSEHNVLLTDAQHASLLADLGETMLAACIEELSIAKAMKGYKYKRDDLAIRQWVIKAVKEKQAKSVPAASSLPRPYVPPPEIAAMVNAHYAKYDAEEARGA